MNYDEIIKELEALSNPDAKEGMAKYGITAENVYGVSLPDLRKLAKKTGKDHALAQQLWAKNTRETRILAGMVAEPKKVTNELMEGWVKEFDYWEICDQVCMNLFWLVGNAYEKAVEWTEREEEFVKRAGFALIARLAWMDKKATNEQLEELLPVIKRKADDGRNYVKKGVDWALRTIGKRNSYLNTKAIAAAEELLATDAKSAKWIAKSTLKELTSEKIQARLKSMEEKR